MVGKIMKNPLNKGLKKEWQENLSRYLSIAIVMIVMISAASGFLTAAYSSKDILETNLEQCNVEDGQFTLTSKMDHQTKTELETLDIKVYKQFYSEQDINDDTMIRVYKERKNTNLVTVFSGRLPVKNDEIALDRLFAKKNNYEIGDTILINDQDLTVVGTISAPDYSSLIEKNSDLMRSYPFWNCHC